MGWLIAAFIAIILIGLAMLPLRFICLYDADGFFAQARIGFIKLMLYPRDKEKKEEAEKKTQNNSSAETAAGENNPQPNPHRGGKLKDFYPLVRIALSFLNELRKRIVVKNLEMNLILAGGDPANLAVNYGRSWAALGNLMPTLERYLDIRKRDLQIECDFEGSEPSIYGYICVQITLGRSLWLMIRYGVKFFKELIALKNTRKGGAQV